MSDYGDQPRVAPCGCKPWDAYDLHSGACHYQDLKGAYMKLSQEYDQEVLYHDLAENELRGKIEELRMVLKTASIPDLCQCQACTDIVKEFRPSALCEQRNYEEGTYGIHGCGLEANHIGPHICSRQDCKFEWTSPGLHQ